MDTTLPLKFPFILDRNLAKANCSGNNVCTSCDIVVLDSDLLLIYMLNSVCLLNPLLRVLVIYNYIF